MSLTTADYQKIIYDLMDQLLWFRDANTHKTVSLWDMPERLAQIDAITTEAVSAFYGIGAREPAQLLRDAYMRSDRYYHEVQKADHELDDAKDTIKKLHARIAQNEIDIKHLWERITQGEKDHFTVLAQYKERLQRETNQTIAKERAILDEEIKQTRKFCRSTRRGSGSYEMLTFMPLPPDIALAHHPMDRDLSIVAENKEEQERVELLVDSLADQGLRESWGETDRGKKKAHKS